MVIASVPVVSISPESVGVSDTINSFELSALVSAAGRVQPTAVRPRDKPSSSAMFFFTFCLLLLLFSTDKIFSSYAKIWIVNFIYEVGWVLSLEIIPSSGLQSASEDLL